MDNKSHAVILTIPVLPDLDLSANRRRSRHFMEQAKDTANERVQAGLLLRDAKVQWLLTPTVSGDHLWVVNRQLPFPVAVHWTLYWPKGERARDADGCADLLKPWIDAMKDLGWIPNDSPRYVRTVSYTSIPSSPKGPSMTLRIERILKVGR